MVRDDAKPTKHTKGVARPPNDGNFWEKFGWETTNAVCLAIGAFGLLQFMLAISAIPVHPLVDTFELLVLLPATPILIFVGITATCVALHNAVRHFVFDG